MSDLAPQKINLSFGGLLQVPGGLTSSLQSITDGNGVSSPVLISTTGVSAPITSDTVTITGGTINGTAIGATNPSTGRFSSLTAGTLTGLLKGTTGIVSVATANTDYLTPPSGTSILKANSGGALANAIAGTDYAPATSGSAILKGNGSGGFTAAVANTDYQGVISATGVLKGAGSGSINSATAGVDYSAGTSALATGILKSTTSTGALSIAVSGTDYAPATSGTSILKGNGAGGFTNAVSGVDYAPATSGTSILYGNGSGGFSNVTVGSGLQFVGGTLASTSAGGSVTTVSVVSANGFTGTVANASSTPAITLTTSVTGLLKGNGTAISAAVAGTDYAAANASFTLGSTSVSLGGTTTTVAGLTLTNPTINGFTGNTSVVNIGSGQFYKDTSGNVGIGTSSPNISAAGTALTILGSSTNRANLELGSTTASASSVFGQTAGYNGATLATLVQFFADGATDSGAVKFFTKATGGSITERMRLDSSGNLGLGVTPSGASGNWRDFDIRNAAISARLSDGAVSLYCNSDSRETYLTTNPASNYYQVSGTHRWLTAPSGTAGNAISFTQAMTLDASGYLLVGYTSSNGAYKLQVNSQIFATSAIIATSDANYKTNVKPISSGLSLINALNPVQFNWKAHEVHAFDVEQPTVGFLAQEVEAVLKDTEYVGSIVYKNECELLDGSKEEFLGLADGKMIPLLVAAIKELSAELNELKAKVNA